MTWIAVIALALAAFAVIALVLRAPGAGWMTVGAALLFGLAGYAWQAQPSIPSSPKAAVQDVGEEGWALVEARQEMVAEADRSQDNMVLFADGQTRQGRYADAATILDGVTEDNPDDADAWLALGNVLVEHADGTLSPAALHAYRRAEQADEGSVGPGYFVGIGQIRQGNLLEARQTWASTLANAREDATGRDALSIRLQRLDELLQQAGAPPLEGSS